MAPAQSPSPSTFWRGHVPFHPWIYFLIFLSSNTLLSFVPLPLASKLWIGLGGILLPLTAGFHALWEQNRKPKPSITPSPPKDFPIPPWLWILTLFLFFFSRFYRLTSLPFWPLSDEGISGFLGLRQSQHWHWTLLWAQDRVEPFLIWFFGLFFKAIEPSLLSLRLVAAFFSIGTCLAAYWAARCYLNRFNAFVLFCLFFSSFWEMTLSRNCLIIIPVPLFQCLCLGLLGGFLLAPNSSERLKNFGWLTVLATLGFYTWTNWAGVWLGLACILGLEFFRKKAPPQKWIWISAIVTLLGILPLLAARLAPGGLDHIRQLGSWSVLSPLKGYLTGIFWNGFVSFPFGSSWGGLLNPVMASLVFLGILHFFQIASRRTWLYGTFLLFFSVLPGILAKSIDLNRMLPLYPLLTALSALGFQSLVSGIRKPLAWMGIFAVVVGGSFGLDSYNYFFHYCSLLNIPREKQWRNVQFYDAYRILSDLSRQEGPLNLFTEFNTDYDNKTLDLACYPFDAVQNPSLRMTSPRWTVLICNLQYAPYFIQHFPGLKIQLLSTDKRGPEDPKPFAIFRIPTSQIPPARLEDWKAASEIYREVDFEVKNKSSIVTWEGPLESHPQLSTQFQQDPFLTAIYWEKVGFFKFLDVHFLEATQAYENAIRLGIPAAHLYYDLGVCLKLQSRTEESQKCFERAAALSKFIN